MASGLSVPSRLVRSADGTAIAVFGSGPGDVGGDAPALVLVHGAAADHTTFRVIGPRLAERYAVHAIDRRGRGGSGDTTPYAIEREFEDVAAVAESIASETGDRIAVIGHSYGGRCALGAALLTDAIGEVVCYEGAPTPPGVDYGDAGLADELAKLDRAGQPALLLEAFLRRVVGMDGAAIAAYQADPIWPLRVAAAHTIPRELMAEGRSGAAGLESLARVRQPVLQVLGGDSRPEFAAATAALDERLANGIVAVIPGARHAAHHSHPDALIEAIETFLAGAHRDPKRPTMGYSAGA
ncbi:MAG: alpha/beta fold hydrolase [Chloroflexota bacterium]